MEISAFGYARKSPDDKEDTKTSIDNQCAFIRLICENKGWQLKHIFIDKNVSGSDRDRKEFGEMIYRSTIKKEATIIVVRKDNRFARDPAFFIDKLKDLDVHGVRVYDGTKGNFLSHQDLGDTITAVLSAQAIIDGKRYAEEMFQRKLKEGMPPVPPPYGYKVDGNKNWVVDRTASRKVQAICSGYLSQQPPSEAMKQLKVNKSLYYRILRHIKQGLYSGFVSYQRKYRDSNNIIVRTETVSYRGSHDVIIPETTLLLFNPDFKGATQ